MVQTTRKRIPMGQRAAALDAGRSAGYAARDPIVVASSVVPPVPAGPDSAAAELFDKLYDELKRIAHRHLAAGGATLQTTGLVHEVYLKLAQSQVVDEQHLLNLASRAMRQVLVDTARARGRDKRGGGLQVVTLTERSAPEAPSESLDVLALESSLQRLELADPRLAQVVELHFFGGLSFPEMSRVLRVAERTLFRDWRAARALIHADLMHADLVHADVQAGGNAG